VTAGQNDFDFDFEKMQRRFMVVNRYVLALWRARLGWLMSCCPPLTGRVMVITTTGRTSGLTRPAPVNYAVVDGDLWVTTHAKAQWLRNAQVDPRVQVWLPFGGRWHGVAEDLPVDAEHVEQFRAVLASGGWIVTRLGHVRPRRASTAELLEYGREFHLLRIRRGGRA